MANTSCQPPFPPAAGALRTAGPGASAPALPVPLPLRLGVVLPLPLVLLGLARLELAFAHPEHVVNLVPGATWLGGTPATMGTFWLDLTLGTGSAFLLSWGLIVDRCLTLRPPSGAPAGWREANGWLIGSSLLFLIAWALSLAERTGRDEVVAVFLALRLPALVLTYGLLGWSLRFVAGIAAVAGYSVALGLLYLACQLAAFEPGAGFPNERGLFVLGALPILAALGLGLGLSERALRPPPAPSAS